MAAGVRELRRRIRGFKSTQQITRAMKMVAAARLLKAQERATAARPYGDKINAMLRRVMAAHAAAGDQRPGATSPSQGGLMTAEALMAERPVQKAVYVVMTSDRGLSGSFNANLIKLAVSTIKARHGVAISVFPVGRKGYEFLSKRGYDLAGQIVPAGDEATFVQARHLAHELTALFVSGKADEVNLVFSEFVNAMTNRPTVFRLFPIGGPAAPSGDGEAAQSDEPATTAPGAEVDYIYEPSGPEVLSALLPRYVQVLVYRALLETRASEHGARMTAMGQATDNASDLIEKLTLDMNRARQAAITREIAEIVGGAEALK